MLRTNSEHIFALEQGVGLQEQSLDYIYTCSLQHLQHLER